MALDILAQVVPCLILVVNASLLDVDIKTISALSEQ